MSANNCNDTEDCNEEVARAKATDTLGIVKPAAHMLSVDTTSDRSIMADRKVSSLGANAENSHIPTPSDSSWRLSLTVDIIRTGIISPPGLRSKFVVYFIQLRLRNTTHADDCHNDCIERRYTDFRLLHRSLKKAYPELMSKLVFPKKLYTGNFSPENIARRSQAFEQYLCHLLDMPEIQCCNPFTKFFYSKELRDGIKNFHKLQYSVSISKMSKAVRNLELIFSPTNELVTFAYSVMVSCYSSLDDHFECYEYAMKAINSIESRDKESPLLIPLLIKAVHMAVSLGRDKSALEIKISQQQSNSLMTVESIPTLQEVLLSKLETDCDFSAQ